MEWDIDRADEDPMEDFGITPPRGQRREAASRSCWHREEEDCMDTVRLGVLGGAYMVEPRRSHVDIEKEMAVAALGTHDGREWEPQTSSRPPFMVFKATIAAMWEDLKNILLPT